MIRRLLLFLVPAALAAQSLPGTAALRYEGDPAAQMVDGMGRYLERVRKEMSAARSRSPESLRRIIGAVDERAETRDLELVASLNSPPLLASSAQFDVSLVRWAAFDDVQAVALHYRPKRPARRLVIALPDASQRMDQFAEAQRFAAADAEVLVMHLLSSVSPPPPTRVAHAKRISEREWLYRMSFPVGRHPIGYEVQKTLAAVDWWKRRNPSLPVMIYGKSDGGWIAQFAAALDPRIDGVEVEDASIEPASFRDQPVYRNLFGILRAYDDAALREALVGRTVRIPRASPDSPVSFSESATARVTELAREQLRQLVEKTQRLVRDSRRERDRLWQAVKGATPSEWRRNAEPLARRFREDVIGTLPDSDIPLNARSKQSGESDAWTGHEVMFDVRAEFGGYGVLLVPKGLKPGERRPLVVAQHGLHGRPQHLFNVAPGRPLEVYRNFGDTLARQGWVVYLPQNPYIGEFRHLAKLANPLGLSFYSLMDAQYARMMAWLTSLPFVDVDRIGFYGLSYGGKTALRIPPFDQRFKAVVCGGDFNEWIGKLTTPDEPWSYVFTEEYEILEWDMAHVASHAELAMLTAPRAFMVERGHRDGVGIDEWVEGEYARVRRFYDELGIGERTSIAFFNGPHRVDGPAALAFLKRFLTEE